MPFDPSSAVLDEPKPSTGFDPSGGVELVEEQPQAVQPTGPIPEPMPFWEAQRKASAELAALSPEARQEMQTPLVKVPEDAFVPMPVKVASALGLPGSQTAQKIARGVIKPLRGMVEMATSPVGIATLPAFVGAPELMGPMTSVQAFPGIKEGYETAKQGIKEGDIEKTVGGISEAVANTVFTALGPVGLAAGPRAFGVREKSTPPKPPAIPPVVEVGTHEKLMPRATETFEDTTGTSIRALPAPGETLRPSVTITAEGRTITELTDPINLPASPLGPRTAGYRIELPIEPESAKVAREQWSKKPIDIEAEVTAVDALRSLVEITEETKTPGQPYKPPTVNVDLRQLERMMQKNTVSKVESWADQVIKDKLSGTSANPFFDPEFLAAAAVKGAMLYKRGVVKFAEWQDAMRLEFGNGIEAKLPAIYEQSKNYWEQRAKEVTNASEVSKAGEVHGNVLWDAQEGKGTEALPINEGQPGVRTEAEALTSTPLYHGSFKVDLSELKPTKIGDFGSGVYLTTDPKLAQRFADSSAFGISAEERAARGPGKIYDVSLKKEPKNPWVADDTPLTKQEKDWWNNTEDGLEDWVQTRSDLVDHRSGRNYGPWEGTELEFTSKDWNEFAKEFGHDALVVGNEIVIKDPSLIQLGKKQTKPAPPSTRQAPESPAPAAEAVRGPSTSGVAASEVPPVIREATTESASAQLSPSEQAKLFTPEALATPKEQTAGVTPVAGVKPTDVKAVKNFFQKHFTVAGHLPREIWEGPKLAMEGEISSLQTGLKYIERDFMNALGEVYGLNRVQIAGGGAKRIPVQAVQLMDEYLKGRVANGAAIPAPIRGVLDTMRAEIDGWSQKVMAQLQAQANRLPPGSAEAKALQQRIDTIRNNLDIYVHRSYKFFDSKASAPDWYENLNAGIRTRAEDYLINNATTPITRSQAQSLLLNWLNDLKEGGGFGSGKLGSKDLSIFLKRKSIAPEIREVLGEYHNPLVNYAKSVSKMGEWVAKQRFLEETKRVGMGRWLFEEDTAPPGYNTRIAGEGSETMSPLNGLRTTKEIADAFKEFDKASDYGWMARTYLTVNAWSKIAATALSVMTQARNLLSRPFMAGMAGHWQYGNLGKSIKAIAQDFAGTDKTWQAYIQKLQKLNVLGDTSRSGELRAILKDASLQDVAPGDLYSFSTWRAIKKYGYELPKEFYRMSDELGNIFGFENERALQAKINPTWTPEQLDAAAAKVVRDLYPTYSETPGAVRAFRKVPLTGPFVTFPYQVFRTTWNSFARSFHEIRSSNPMERAVGYKRLSSQMATIAATWAVQEAAKNALGVTTQQETDFRRFQPPWSRNSKWAFTAKDEKTGSLSAINLSYMDPYSYISDPMVALASAIRDDKDLFETFVQVGTEALRPWVSEQMLTKALIEARNGKTDTGREIYNTTDSSYDKFTKQVGHVVKALEPGTVQRFQKRILPAARNEQPVYGRKLELGPEIAREVFGLAVEKFDFKTGLAYRAKDFIEKDRASESVFHQTLSRTETTTPENLLEAYKESDSRRQLIWKEMRKDFLAAVRNGVTENDARKTMEARGMTKEDARNIAQGRYKPLEISDQARKRATERGREIPRQAIRDYQQTARNISLDD